jgi:hypothetical protein
MQQSSVRAITEALDSLLADLGSVAPSAGRVCQALRPNETKNNRRGDIKAVILKTPDFSQASEFSVGTGR